MKDSVQLLAKSQLLTLKGETVVLATTSSDGSPAAALKHFQVGSVIDQKYKIIDLLGEGGMGAVYKAHHIMLGKEVALITFLSTDQDADYLKRFQREAQAIGLLTHPNIVQVFDYGLGEDNLPYYTMESLAGETLADRLAERGHLPLDQTVAIFLQVCQGLSVAHRKGIIHRDLKPGNIFLEKSRSSDPLFPRVKIVDFGLATLTSHSLAGQKLTSTGTIFGSPLYRSPEQSLGQEMSESSDVYSCGCALYETLTGTPQYKGETAFATMLKHQSEPVPVLFNPRDESEFPLRLKSLVGKMLTKDQNKRIQTFDQVASELKAILQAGPAEAEAEMDGGAGEATSDPQDRYRSKKSTTRIKTLALLLVTTVCAIAVATNLHWLGHPKTLAKISPNEVALPPVTRADDLETPVTLIEEPDHKVAPYRQVPDPTRPGWRIFMFPKNVSLGTLQWAAETKFAKKYKAPPDLKAKGKVLVPPQVRLHLTASRDLIKNPRLFEGFGKDDLNLVIANNIFECNDEDVAYISKLTGLHELSLDSTSITDRCIKDLNKLQHLSHLSLRSTSLTAPELAKVRILPKLQQFAIASMVDAPLVLQRLTNNHKILELIINACDLTDKDLDVLPTMPNISVLFLNGNGKISDNGLKTIAKLNQLTELHVDGTAISPASTVELKTMRNLTLIVLNADLWKEEDVNQLRNLMPRQCKVETNRDSNSKKNHLTEFAPFIKP